MPHAFFPELPTDYFKQGQHTGGSRIPDGATQVVADTSAIDCEAIIHTVTSGKTLYLSAVFCGCHNADTSAHLGYLFVTNAADVIQYQLVYFYLPGTTGNTETLSLSPPLEIQEGWKVKVFSEAATLHAVGVIHGYEI